jgi:hypothetical protein
MREVGGIQKDREHDTLGNGVGFIMEHRSSGNAS